MADRMPSAHDARRGVIHINHMGGHHPSYAALFERLFGLTPSVGTIDRGRRRNLVAADRLFFGTIDDDVAGFAHIALRRMMRGKQTAGIFMQPQTCLAPSVRARFKRWIFWLLSRAPNIDILSIVPFPAVDGASKVATDWVHDPQLWDAVDEADSGGCDSTAVFTQVAGGRPILAFLGTVSRVKGIEHLAAIMTANSEVGRQLCIIVAGAVQPETRDAANAIAAAGGCVIDRRIDDAELFALYRSAKAIWCAYAEDFDQASGVFGRAIQFGRRPIIRNRVRVMGYYADRLGAQPIVLMGDPHADAAEIIRAVEAPQPHIPNCAEELKQWQTDFTARVEQALSRDGNIKR